MATLNSSLRLPSQCSAISRWPVLETGRNSVRPSTMPSTTACSRSLIETPWAWASRSCQGADRLRPQGFGRSGHDAITRLASESRAVPVADPATRALDHRNECHEIVRLERPFDDQIAVAGGQQAVDVAIAPKAAHRRAA